MDELTGQTRGLDGARIKDPLQDGASVIPLAVRTAFGSYCQPH